MSTPPPAPEERDAAAEAAGSAGESGPSDRRSSRAATLVTAGAVVAVLALGFVIGLISTLAATALVRLGPVHLSVGALVAGPGNAVLGIAAAWGLRSREASMLPAVGWFMAVLVGVFAPRPGGDIVVPGSGWDVGAFVIVGIAGAAVAVVAVGRGAAGDLPVRGRLGGGPVLPLPPASPRRPPGR